jgi:hypothetical protein
MVVLYHAVQQRQGLGLWECGLTDHLQCCHPAATTYHLTLCVS